MIILVILTIVIACFSVFAMKNSPSLSQHLVPIERQSLSAALDGSAGIYRNPNPALSLTRAGNDLDAIEEWLTIRSNRSAATERSYRKEAERLLAWAIVEHNKPVSSLDMQDLAEYEQFLMNPVSRHAGVNWTAKKHVDLATQATSTKRYRRDDPAWRPFDGPLTHSSVEHAMKVLKSMFSFWTDVGYSVVNPLKVRKPGYKPQKDAVKQRVLSVNTWKFLYSYLDELEGRLPKAGATKQRLQQLRAANQAYMIFTSLYLLGVRLSELVSIRMCDFSRRSTSENTENFWLTITGKGNKVRTIPVPEEFFNVLMRYRRNLNTFPTQKRRKADPETVVLLCTPSGKDTSSLILSASGKQSIGASALHKIIKATLANAVNFYYEKLESGQANGLSIDVSQLQNASAHWMRHTSATHQTLKGVSLRYIKDNLGHASFDTTISYNHLEDDQWAKEVSKFTAK